MANEAMVKKGQKESLIGLRDQSGYHAELLTNAALAALLAKKGWTPEDTAKFLERKGVVDSERAEQVETREASKGDTRSEGAAVTEAKAFKFQLGLGVEDVFAQAIAKGETLPVDRKVFNTGRLGELKRSTPKLISYLSDVRPHVVTLDEPLKPFFENTSPVERLDTVLTNLKSTQGKQELSVASLPLETQEVYEAKGYLLHMIERINRLGKGGAAGDAKTAALFNKDLLLNARREQKKIEEPAQPAA